MDMNRHMGGESGHPRACRTRLRTAHPARRAGTEKTQEKFFSGRPTRTNPVHLSGPWWGRLEEAALVPWSRLSDPGGTVRPPKMRLWGTKIPSGRLSGIYPW